MTDKTDHSYSVLHGRPLPNEVSPIHVSPLDNVITDFMLQQRIPGASLALSWGGKLVYKQGYGIAATGKPVTSHSLFRLASLSKPITAIAIMKLVQDGKLCLNDKVFGPKGILHEYRPTTKSDKRITNITVRHLLQHSAGWDRDQVGDPVFWKLDKVTKGMDPTCNEALIKYMMTKKLQFAPGKRHAYSNFGYLILGMVLERVTEMEYIDYIHSIVRCIDLEDIYVGYRKRTACHYNEVEYFNNREPAVTVSVYSNEEGHVLPQYGGFKMEGTEAFGGLVASAVDLLLFFNNLTCQESARRILNKESFEQVIYKPSYELGKEWYGLGLDVQDDGQTYGHTGAMEGTSTTYLHHKSGFSWVLLFNSWSKDMDIDGMFKFGLSQIPRWPLYSDMTRTLNFDMKIKNLKIVSKNELQIVQLFLPFDQFEDHINELTNKDYRIISVNMFVYDNYLFLNLIWNKNVENDDYLIKLVAYSDPSILGEEIKRDNYIVLLDSCIWNKNIYFVYVFKKISIDTDIPQVIVYHENSKEYLKKMSLLRKEEFCLKIQSVAEHENNLYVSAVFEKYVDNNIKDISWLQISTDNFLFELNKQTNRKFSLDYVKFYTVNDDPCVSAVWSSKTKTMCLQRHNASIYGFLYELIQSMENGRDITCICSYYNDGVLNFAAIWDSGHSN